MKRILILAVALLLVSAGVAMAGVGSTPHDLSTSTNTQVCVACHTPHASAASANGPLWNRSQAAQTYTLYTSATFDMTSTAVGPQTIACMTCHNGVAATLVNYPGSGSPGPMANYDTPTFINPGQTNLGTNLTDDHPVGFTYDPAADATNSFPALSGNQVGATGMFVYDNSVGNDQFECATCHDVHDSASPGVKDPVYFLRTSNVGSAMCGACHTTKL